MISRVVLTGFMGTGKTTVGRLLAAQLGFGFVDTDFIIEERYGPIEEVFLHQGESAFRRIERSVAAELADRQQVVISTGGKMLLDSTSETALRNHSLVICLVASPDEILDRISSDDSRTERPLLAVARPRERIDELLAERESAYARFPQVSTDGRTAEAVANELAARFRAATEQADVGANTDGLPTGLELVRTTPDFDEGTVPAGLLRTHRVAADVWGNLVVKGGSLDFAFDDDTTTPLSLSEGDNQPLPPQAPHCVILTGPVRFAVEFYKFPMDT